VVLAGSSRRRPGESCNGRWGMRGCGLYRWGGGGEGGGGVRSVGRADGRPRDGEVVSPATRVPTDPATRALPAAPGLVGSRGHGAAGRHGRGRVPGRPAALLATRSIIDRSQLLRCPIPAIDVWPGSWLQVE
jgi:hypothetical protein